MKVLREIIDKRSSNIENEGTMPTTSMTVATPNFPAFDSSAELWSDYWSRFCTFSTAHSVPESKKPKVFLSNQTSTIYKMLSNLAAQESLAREINALSMDEISEYMKKQFDPKRFVVRERFRFWNDMKRKFGESIPELAAHIRQASATCDFTSTTDPLDEAQQTRFICSVNNEAVLKALFKIKVDELTFTRAIKVATETEDAAKVAKETVYGSNSQQVHKVKSFQQGSKKATNHQVDEQTKRKRYQCGKSSHLTLDCRFKTSTCNFCKIQGHLEVICCKKALAQKSSSSTHSVKSIGLCTLSIVTNNVCKISSLQLPIIIASKNVIMEMNTATSGKFLSKKTWSEIGEFALEESPLQYQSASKHVLLVVGTFTALASLQNSELTFNTSVTVTEVPNLNLLGR